MDGLGGYGGWRWIFIIEGIITVVVAVLGWFLIMDFPEQALENNKFLTTEEVEIMINRVDADRGDARIEKFSIWHYLENTLDWKAWILASNFGLTAIVVYSVAYFLPIVLREGLGFSIVQAQTLSAPVSVQSLYIPLLTQLTATLVLCFWWHPRIRPKLALGPL